MNIFDLFRGSKDERIARRFIKTLREAGERRHMEYVSTEGLIVALNDKGEREQVSFLGNLQREIDSAAVSDHDAIYRRYAASHKELLAAGRTSDYAVIGPTLRILLKDETYPVYIALQNQVDLPDSIRSSPIVYERITGDVIACCVEASESSLRFVTEADVAKWGVSAEQALNDAKSNVCVLACDVRSIGLAHYVFADDSFQAARLVNVALFANRPARGEWVAVVPDRDTYFLTESEDLEGLAGLARLSERQFAEGGRLISGTPFVMRNGGWQVFKPPEAVKVAFGNVARQFAISYWRDYKAVLEKYLARRGEDIFVASLKLYEDEPTEAYWSATVWSKGVDSILPMADRVMFFENEELAIRMASWEDVLHVMGPSMRVLEGVPIRYRVQQFPSTAQLLAMGARAG